MTNQFCEFDNMDDVFENIKKALSVANSENIHKISISSFNAFMDLKADDMQLNGLPSRFIGEILTYQWLLIYLDITKSMSLNAGRLDHVFKHYGVDSVASKLLSMVDALRLVKLSGEYDSIKNDPAGLLTEELNLSGWLKLDPENMVVFAKACRIVHKKSGNAWLYATRGN